MSLKLFCHLVVVVSSYRPNILDMIPGNWSTKLFDCIKEASYNYDIHGSLHRG